MKKSSKKAEMPHFPFTEREFLSRRSGKPNEPELFAKIREAARTDIHTLLEQLLPILFDRTEMANLPFEQLNGPMSRDAFLVRVEDALMHFNEIRTLLPYDGCPILKDTFHRYESSAARLLISAAFGGSWQQGAMEFFNVYLNCLKSFATILSLHGQVAGSIALLRRILVLLRLKEIVDKGNLWEGPKKAWPLLTQLEIVFGVLHYLDRGIIPARIHLQEERKKDAKNFSDLFSPLKIGSLIPSGHLPKSEFLRKLDESPKQPRQAYYKIHTDAPDPGPNDKWPAYMSSKAVSDPESVRRALSGPMDDNYFHSRKDRPDPKLSAELRWGKNPDGTQRDIELIKYRLRGIYRHLLLEFGQGDLSTADDLEHFHEMLRGLGISLDF